MSADVVLGEIVWLGENRSVEVIISEGNDALIGTELFDGAKLVIDYIGGVVEISRSERALNTSEQ